jgi:hypothetical protein
MEHESFTDPKTAEIMNRFFINIKVDREERPDLDDLYMQAVVAMTGQGGWPMSVFLTPTGEPFFGGTYFPPARRFNLPGFREVLLSVAQAWQEHQDEMINTSQKITRHLRESTIFRSLERGTTIQEDITEKAATKLIQSYDWEHGGWGEAPKFPQPMIIDFLLNRTALGDQRALNHVTHLLDRMASGGMYDVVGGGFSRYSTDTHWLVPHFEKMLYDNAQLSRTYLHGFLITGNASYRRICEETLDFIVRELRDKTGGFYSSLDADSEGEEGKFYLWTLDEIRNALHHLDDFRFYTTAYSITQEGNFEGKNILQKIKTDTELAQLFQITQSEVERKLVSCNKQLLHYRNQRVRPATDDKILASWNALTLIAFAEAARYLNRDKYLEIAQHNANFLLSELHPGDRLLRAWRSGRAQHNAYLEDYAASILGFLSLYQTDYDAHWFKAASELTTEMVNNFRDPEGGFFDTRDDHEKFWMRPKEIQDNATPSGNSLAVSALMTMSGLTGNVAWRDLAEESIRKILPLAEKFPTAFPFWLTAMDFALSPVLEVAVIGNLLDRDTLALIQVIHSAYRPFLVSAAGSQASEPPLLAGRLMLGGKPSAYVCQNFVCKNPVSEPEKLADQLNQTNSSDTGQ